MLFEQKSRRKSSVEMEVCPYKRLTRHPFPPKISTKISSEAIKLYGFARIYRISFCAAEQIIWLIR